ncbi:MAG: HlyD family efflux transporter periplasmic adaptor subunit [Lachnospiraceae bacterium]|nr:HlyD family efflux transporter periplasmic adaptor subunit [Lachnospiraceae bacterium]MBD5511429.1 HlyD family efflux transporter periplasmic adaptor subunit [Lachnospiraceae bacterium]
MNEKKGKRREWVKTAAIVFLSVLLVLTFFSNTIMNYSLPEVAVQYITSGTITAKVRGTGTVESGDLYEVKATESRKVQSVAVRVGDHVEIGDVICYLADEESEELKAAREALEPLYDSLEAAQQAYNAAVLTGDLSVAAMQGAGSAESAASYKNRLIAAQSVVESLEQQLKDTEPAYNEAKEAKEAADLALADVQNELNNLNTWIQYNQETVTSGNAGLAELNKQKNIVQQLFYDAQNTANRAAAELSKIETERGKIEAQLAVARADVTTLAGEINTALRLSQLNDAVKDARAAIAKQEEKIAELEAKAVGATINAEIAGTIVSVNVVAGGQTTSGGESTVAVIQPEGKGFTLSFSVTAEQAKRISVGDPAELVNSWWYSNVTATVASVKPDPSDPSRSKLVTCNLDGDLTAGQTLSLQIGQRSQNYDMIVPNSAIREDNNGKFILVVEPKSSPLGTRYYAVRYDIEVLASDDTQSAISGGLYGYESVITTSTKPVEAGQLVRLPD